jgi:hypothetical protein
MDQAKMHSFLPPGPHLLCVVDDLIKLAQAKTIRRVETAEMGEQMPRLPLKGTIRITIETGELPRVIRT